VGKAIPSAALRRLAASGHNCRERPKQLLEFLVSPRSAGFGLKQHANLTLSGAFLAAGGD
jgi:hypothetical protein